MSPPGDGGTIVNAGVVGSGRGTVRNAVSNDGQRIFWSTGENSVAGHNLTGLYLRDLAVGETVRLDTPQPGVSGAGEVSPIFQGASADGTVVYFTDPQQLTDNASPDGQDLYRCEVPADDSSGGCATLIDVSAPSPDLGKAPSRGADRREVGDDEDDDGPQKAHRSSRLSRSRRALDLVAHGTSSHQERLGHPLPVARTCSSASRGWSASRWRR